jgi:hypothetical protein
MSLYKDDVYIETPEQHNKRSALTTSLINKWNIEYLSADFIDRFHIIGSWELANKAVNGWVNSANNKLAGPCNGDIKRLHEYLNVNFPNLHINFIRMKQDLYGYLTEDMELRYAWLSMLLLPKNIWACPNRLFPLSIHILWSRCNDELRKMRAATIEEAIEHFSHFLK